LTHSTRPLLWQFLWSCIVCVCVCVCSCTGACTHTEPSTLARTE
jgi:hypothetical protein